VGVEQGGEGKGRGREGRREDEGKVRGQALIYIGLEAPVLAVSLSVVGPACS